MNFYSYILMHYRMSFWGSILIFIILIIQTLMIFGFKKIYDKDNDEYNEVSLNILQVIGTIYAILLGLLTYQVLNNFQLIQATISQEAIEIGNISSHVDAGIRNPKHSQQIQKDIYAYVNNIIESEFFLQQTSTEGIHRQQFFGWMLLEKIANDLVNLDASETIKGKILDNLNSLYDARRQRINYRDMALPNVIWQIFSISIFFMMINIAIVCCHDTKLKIFTSYLYVISLILIFIIVIDLDSPFYGTVNVDASDYYGVRDSMIALHGLKYFNS
jgi:hypothetical protein